MYKIYSKVEKRFLDSHEAIVQQHGIVLLIDQPKKKQLFTYILTLADMSLYEIKTKSPYTDKFGNELYEDDYVIDKNNKQGKIVKQSDGSFRVQMKNAHGNNYNSKIYPEDLQLDM